MAVTTVHRPLLRGRAALCVIFACFGTTLAIWAVHLPSLQRATGMSTAMLGTVLLLSGVGAFVGMQVCGPLADRWGSGPVATAATTAMVVGVTVPLAAGSTTFALCGALVFGVATGSAEVSMNAAAVALERRYARPIMASFHAVFSMGNVAGSIVAAVGFALHVTTLTATASVAGGCTVLILATSPWLRGALRRPAEAREAEDAAAEDADTAGVEPNTASRARRIAVLGTLAFLFLLSEGAAMDWASLHAQQHLDASPALGATAFGAFVAAMTVGRLLVDRIAHRIGPVAVARRGSVVAAIGMIVVIISPALPLTVGGWILFGLGLAGGVPQVFTAAGNLQAESGRALARVVGVGYVAMMAGPATIGWLAQISSLAVAMVLPLCAVTICALCASAVEPRS
jgi:MFS family permease